ncbi:hypothetical protein [Paracoccus aminophilus]|uniref:Uncharacterized protein n=1 Tax=Paracoccus aminophilus JCM 7686 TaxID=1367847 RepID=S5XX71_PARAH|nr:hypothetical protein [Paracoccus aminophilus]AGT09917.1 hypothetical protein JCM7686_2861 [Paracoccus aminophilus JCM 7686]
MTARTQARLIPNPVGDYNPIPQYGPVKTYRSLVIGGTKMSALLWPKNTLTQGTSSQRGGTTATNLKAAISALKATDDNKYWIAGHLLNAEMGGRGEEQRNLTPLTGVTNQSHARFEGVIKNALVTLDRTYSESLRDNEIDSFWSAQYSVSVHGNYHDTNSQYQEYNMAPEYISLEFKYFRLKKTGPRILLYGGWSSLFPHRHLSHFDLRSNNYRELSKTAGVSDFQILDGTNSGFRAKIYNI